MRRVSVLFLAIVLFNALPAFSQSYPESSYCTGIPEDVKTHCNQVLLGNYKRALEKIKKFGQNEEIRSAAAGLLAADNRFSQINVKQENSLTLTNAIQKFIVAANNLPPNDDRGTEINAIEQGGTVGTSIFSVRAEIEQVKPVGPSIKSILGCQRVLKYCKRPLICAIPVALCLSGTLDMLIGD